MGISSILRKGESIICFSPKIKSLIKDFMRNEGWNYAEFTDLLETLKLKLPVEIREVSDEGAFQVKDAEGTDYVMTLIKGEIFGSCSEVSITKENVTRFFLVSSKTKINELPKLALIGKKITKDEVILNAFYSETMLNFVINYDKDKAIEISIDEPDKYTANKEKVEIWTNRVQLEKVLILTEYTEDLNEVYHKIIKAMNLTEEKIKKIDEILIFKTEEEAGEEKIREALFASRGKIKSRKNIE